MEGCRRRGGLLKKSQNVRMFPDVYKLPESEIRSLVHSIYDNTKLGDELLDHLSDVINKKKPEKYQKVIILIFSK